MNTKTVKTIAKYPNLAFYTEKLSSSPNGDVVSTIHQTWGNDFAKLEFHHGYIQWLFPLLEGPGMNSKASALTKEEARLMRKERIVGKNFVRSYQMMLRFYGMKVVDTRSGRGLFIKYLYYNQCID